MVAPMDGVRVVEITSWMAAPSAGAVLADMGADVGQGRAADRRRRARDVPQAEAGRGAGRPRRLVPDGQPGQALVAVAIDRPEGAELVRRLVDAPTCSCATCSPTASSATASTRPRCSPQAAARPRHAHRLRARRPRRDAARLRRDDVLRPRRDHRLDDRAGRRRAAAPSGPGRPHHRPGHGRRHPRRAARWPSAPARARSSTSACWPRRRGRWPPTWRPRSSTAARRQARPAPPDRPAGQPLPLRRRPLDRAQHARAALVGPFCTTVGRPECSTTSATDRQGPLRQHARADRHPRRGVRHPDPGRVGGVVRRGRADLGPGVDDRRARRRPPGPATGVFPTIEHPSGAFRTVAAPMRISGADIRPRGPAPTVGGNTVEILTSIGFDQGRRPRARRRSAPRRSRRRPRRPRRRR